MTTEHINSIETKSSQIYQIKFKGQLDTQWTSWFEGLSIKSDVNSNTLITGPVADQAALFGLLKKIRDLGLPLLSVNLTASNKEEAIDNEP